MQTWQNGTGLVGWEEDGPRMGTSYTIHLEGGLVLRTSPVQDIEMTSNGLIIKTANSIYHLKYLGENPGT
jgi:hypothetical protein